MKAKLRLRPDTGYIMVDCTHPGMKQLRLSTNIQVSESEWNVKSEQIKGKDAAVIALNAKLSDVSNRPASFLDKCMKEGTPLTAELLKIELLKLVAPQKAEKINNVGKIVDLLTYTHDYIERNPKNSKGSTLETYEQLIPKLERFAELHGKDQLLFKNITTLWESKFVSFLYKEYNLCISTKDKWIKEVISLMRQAKREKNHSNSEFEDFKTEKKEDMRTDAIDLTEDEILEMYNLELSSELDPARDLWVFSAETGGIRVSDILVWDKNNWIREEDAVKYIPIKTEKELYVPLTNIGKAILVKYNGELPKMTEENYNENLKEIGKLIPSLLELFKVKTTNGGKIKYEYIERYKLLQSHTARRSFCTKELRAGTPKEVIMALSGHETESAFKIYDKRKQEEAAKQIVKFYKSRGKSV